jgi:hypothetical protein
MAGCRLDLGGVHMSAWAVPGAKVVCVNRFGWQETTTGLDCSGPVFGEVCTVSRRPYVDDYDGVVSIDLVEYAALTGGFPLALFRPVTLRTQSEDVAMIKSLLVGDEVDA